MNGGFHVPGSYSYYGAFINFIDKENRIDSLKVERRNNGYSCAQLAELVFNNIILLSSCQDLEQFKAFEQINSPYLLYGFDERPLESTTKISKLLQTCCEILKQNKENRLITKERFESLSKAINSIYKELAKKLNVTDLKI